MNGEVDWPIAIPIGIGFVIILIAMNESRIPKGQVSTGKLWTVVVAGAALAGYLAWITHIPNQSFWYSALVVIAGLVYIRIFNDIYHAYRGVRKDRRKSI